MANQLFTPFHADVSQISQPEKFTFPFSYEPHPLAKLAAEELQGRLKTNPEWPYNFGFDETDPALAYGKMFGVLVVKNKAGTLGYLSAYSGKLHSMKRPSGFVPPVYELPSGYNYFEEGSDQITKLGEQMDALKNSEEFKTQKARLEQTKTDSKQRLEDFRVKVKEARKARNKIRKKAINDLTEDEFTALKKTHEQESLRLRMQWRQLKATEEQIIARAEERFRPLAQKLEQLKTTRKETSAALQQRLFTNFTFLNSAKKEQSLLDIFKPLGLEQPPSGAGECAAPRLLQAAFLNDFEPIAMAEFWWGKSPKSEVRTHGHFYPACKTKCQPILSHMLAGMAIDPNPMLENIGAGKVLETVFEDDVLVVVNKPDGLLSIPGKDIKDSVLTRMKEKYPDATGPLIVHRLDQHTSGLLLIAKNKDTHKFLQQQFINRTVKKRYVALLEKEVNADEKGVINLPLRVDFDNRPYQLVCYEHGKRAITRYEIVARENGQTRIHLFPITGRSHQLRVHMAHQDGLGTAIVGDDLYGQRANRLHLHAEFLEFIHPITEKRMRITAKASF